MPDDDSLTAICEELSGWADAARLLNSDVADLAVRLHRLTQDGPDAQTWHRTSVELHHLRGELDRLARVAWDTADFIGQADAGANPELAYRQVTRWKWNEASQ